MLPYIENAYHSVHSAEPQAKQFIDFVSSTRASIDTVLNARFSDPMAPKEKRRIMVLYHAGLGWINTEGFTTVIPERDLDPETNRHLGLTVFVGRETQDPLSKWLNDHISHTPPVMIVEATVHNLGSSKGQLSKEIFYIGSGVTVSNAEQDETDVMKPGDTLRIKFIQDLLAKLE